MGDVRVGAQSTVLPTHAARSKEIATRAAIGAGRGRIVRQLLTESAVLDLVAAVAGVGLAARGIRLLVANAPADIRRLDQTRIDWIVLAFTLTVALASRVLSGFLPALRAGRAAQCTRWTRRCRCTTS